MDIFTQKKLLIRIVILLTVLNVTLIIVLLIKNLSIKPEQRNTPAETKDVSAVLKRELNLSDEQVFQIKELRKKYFDLEKNLVEEIRNERDSINSFMFAKGGDAIIINKLARRVADNEFRIEMLRFYQAEELKTICTPDQLDKFENLVVEIRDFFRKDNTENQKPDQNPRPDQRKGPKKPRGPDRNQENRPPRRE